MKKNEAASPHLGNWKLQTYRFRMDVYVPPVQLCGSLQSLLQVYFLVAAKFDALLVNGIDQAELFGLLAIARAEAKSGKFFL